MSVFRVEKTKGYTVMSNHHLRNHTLSLKAKGLLSQMLSLPDDWDYTLQGLAQINKESIDAIREAVRELERAGYIKRSRSAMSVAVCVEPCTRSTSSRTRGQRRKNLCRKSQRWIIQYWKSLCWRNLRWKIQRN